MLWMTGVGEEGGVPFHFADGTLTERSSDQSRDAA